MLIIVIILVLLFAGGGGYYGSRQWGMGGGIGIPGIVILILILWLVFGRGRL